MATRMGHASVTVRHIDSRTQHFSYRTPIKFGGVALDQATLLNVTVTVEDAQGRRAVGCGSMPLGNVWSFPSRSLTYAQTLRAMECLTARIALTLGEFREAGHPVDLFHALEPAFLRDAAAVSDDLGLVEPIPTLCTLVCASAYDAAVHDAFGKLLGLNCYHTYGPDLLPRDLGHYLGPQFSGERLDGHVREQPMPRQPIYHLVGALDPLTPAEVTTPVGDDWPESLDEWIRRDGLTHLKIKLNGDDAGWDRERILAVHAVARDETTAAGRAGCRYSLDFNERCPNEDYLLNVLEEVRGHAPAAFDQIQYIEQPTARDLHRHRGQGWQRVSRLKPLVIDESLTDLDALLMARDLGYTGAALKACKGQTHSLLLGAAARKLGMFVCVQDLTCPGASFVHSAGLAAYIKDIPAIEGNARQYLPLANEPWLQTLGALFHVRAGTIATGLLTGPGLGAVPPGATRFPGETEP